MSSKTGTVMAGVSTASVRPRVAIKWEALAVASVTGLAALVRLERLGTRNLWPDEAFSPDLGAPEVL